jgi:UDP-2-acetamido-3-amino-2,3-dideoxy-glucuronate N-acetyltransferase
MNNQGRVIFVGAGTVVTKGIPDHDLKVSNPARQIGWSCVCGEKLTRTLQCEICKKRYKKMAKKDNT